METEEFDRSKLVLSVKDTILKKENRVFTGKMLYERLLLEYHLQMEMAAGSYVIAMTSIGDTKEGMDRLISALFEIDEELEKKSEEEKRYYLPRQEQVFTSFEVEVSGIYFYGICVFVSAGNSADRSGGTNH